MTVENLTLNSPVILFSEGVSVLMLMLFSLAFCSGLIVGYLLSKYYEISRQTLRHSQNFKSSTKNLLNKDIKPLFESDDFVKAFEDFTTKIVNGQDEPEGVPHEIENPNTKTLSDSNITRSLMDTLSKLDKSLQRGKNISDQAQMKDQVRIPIFESDETLDDVGDSGSDVDDVVEMVNGKFLTSEENLIPEESEESE